MQELKALSLDISYRSDTSNVVSEFYVPCLEISRLYRRAAGYFTSSGLSLAARGIARLITTGGRLRLVASPFLDEQDIEAIASGYRSREEVMRGAAAKELLDPKSELERDRLSALAWLISTGALDVKLAFRVEHYSGRIQRGIYHEKIGIFSDDAGNSVAFTGSQNETVGGLIDNFESIDVFCSWIDKQRVDRKSIDFDSLWNDTTKGLAVLDFTEISRELLDRYKTQPRPEIDPEETHTLARTPRFQSGRPIQPEAITLRGYQNDAANNWFKAGGTGIFQLATGTGKTITALAVCERLSSKAGLQAVIVVCPYRHLVSQWADECERFSMTPILAFESRTSWFDALTTSLAEVARNPKEFVCVITTNATFASPAFQQRLKYLPRKTLLIADEVHNLGAEGLAQALPANVELRLGLSATPERWFDDAGTNRLMGYFGSVLDPKIGIKEAIELKALVPYRYHPLLIELTEEERDRYLEISAKIAKIADASGFDEDQPQLKFLLLERARLIASASNKIPALRQLAKKLKNDTQMLFYCGEGRVDDPDEDFNGRQIEAVTRVLGAEEMIKVAIYDHRTDTRERQAMKTQLAEGRLQALVAIRCLDEGVDIPSVKTAVILASSSNPRQFIQRRGRVLRRSEGKTHATIYDMIVIPPRDAMNSDAERQLVKKELLRFREFADLALNAGEALGKVLDVQKHFSLMDV